MRLLADLNIAPRTTTFLRSLGHDLIRVNEVLPGSSSDEQIVAFARTHQYAVLTQDLDFSAIVALSGASTPSIISVRLGSARLEVVNHRLEVVLPTIEEDVLAGAIITVEERAVRSRKLPIS